MGQRCCCLRAKYDEQIDDELEMTAQGTEGSSLPPSPAVRGMSIDAVRQLRARGSRWDDTWRPDAPNSPQFRVGSVEAQVEWIRLSDIARSQLGRDINIASLRLLPNTPSPTSVRQGLLGDCALVTSAAALAAHPALLCRVLEGNDEHLNAAGVYCAQIYRKGERIRVVVDDKIPCVKGKRPYTPAFAHCSSPGEFWLLILEKAYAKFYGSYQAINGGNIAETMHDLTGCPVEGYNLQRLPRAVGGVPGAARLSPEAAAVLRRLTSAVERGCIVTAGMPPTGTPHAVLPNGLVSGHAYTILSVFALPYVERGVRQEVSLVKLYNPWGTRDGGFYKGERDFGILSPFWERQAHLRQHPEVRWDALREGEFFMPAASVLQHFELINVCYVDGAAEVGGGEGWAVRSFAGRFGKRNAGGSRQFVSFRHNDAYLLEVSPPKEQQQQGEAGAPKASPEGEDEGDESSDGSLSLARLRVLVQHREQRGRVKPGTISYPPAGFCVLRVPEGRELCTPEVLMGTQHQVLMDMTFWNRREVAAELLLPAGRTAEGGPQRYLCVPSTYFPGTMGEYAARFYINEAASEPHVRVLRAPQSVPRVTITSKWRHVGDEEYDVCLAGSAEGTVWVCAFLCQEQEGQSGAPSSAPPRKAPTAGSNTKGRYDISLRVKPRDGSMVQAKRIVYSKSTEVHASFEAQKGVTYTLVPCIRKYDRENIPFELAVHCSVPVTVTKRTAS